MQFLSPLINTEWLKENVREIFCTTLISVHPEASSLIFLDENKTCNFYRQLSISSALLFFPFFSFFANILPGLQCQISSSCFAGGGLFVSKHLMWCLAREEKQQPRVVNTNLFCRCCSACVRKCVYTQSRLLLHEALYVMKLHQSILIQPSFLSFGASWAEILYLINLPEEKNKWFFGLNQ